MAINIPIVTDFNSKGLQDASNAFTNFRTKIGEADGAMGKMKAGFGAATDFMKANAGNFAAAAGAAFLGFAVKSIGAFQDLALEVDKFSNVTGLAAEEASRYVEVAGDLGIEASSVSTAIDKMNRQLSANRAAFEDLGVEIARTNSGAIDVNKTFINVIGALNKIDDPSKRAAAAANLLGKNWKEVSEIITMGAPALQSSLDAIAGAKIIDEDDIRRAKEFRAAQDGLKDALESLTISLGQSVVPVLTKLAEGIAEVLDKTSFWGRVTNVTAGIVTRDFRRVADGIWGAKEDIVDAIDDTTTAFWKTQEQMYRTRYEALRLEGQLSDLEEAVAELKGEIDERQAWRNLQEDIQRAGEAALVAFAEQTPEALRASEEATDNARLAAAEYITQLDGIPDEIKTEIIANLDKANVDEIEAILADLTRRRTVEVLVRTRPSEVGSGGREQGTAPPGFETVDTPFGRFERPKDGSGDWRAAGQRSAMNLMGASKASAASVVVNVAGSVTTEKDLVESIRKGLVDAQRNGAQLVYSNY